MSSPIARGFRRRHQVEADPSRVPPGQYVTPGFPVLSAGPTPRTPLQEWTFSITGTGVKPKSWTWEEFRQLPSETVTADVHCVTRWSKLGTTWQGVSVDTLLDQAGLDQAGRNNASFVLARSDGGYSSNLPLKDVTGGQAWVAFNYDGEPLEEEHGGPARLLVPHLYFWKSAKWVRSLELLDHDVPGFWETYGYHNYGDPWREQRFAGD